MKKLMLTPHPALRDSGVGAARPPAQTPAQDPVDTHTIIRSESRLVLVDSVVTDKKGGYVHDLTQKDFKVWEDNKEQAISTFSFEADAPRRQFAEALSGALLRQLDTSPPQSGLCAPGGDEVHRNECRAEPADGDRGVRRHAAGLAELHRRCGPSEEGGGGRQVLQHRRRTRRRRALPRNFTNFSTRSVLGALRNMAKGLAEVPGRKTLVFLSGGLPRDDG